MAVERGWEIESMDVSAAFLKGYTFDEMRDMGMQRQPVCMQPDDHDIHHRPHYLFVKIWHLKIPRSHSAFALASASWFSR